MITEEQRSRYARQIALDGMGEAGQERLLRARVLIIGAGGLASPAALYLAAAGIGCIGIADGDTVSISNLQRQIIHSFCDMGREKVSSAKEKMEAINPDCKVITYPRFLQEKDLEEIIESYDFIIEATDSFESRFRVSDLCVRKRKPYVMGGVEQYMGQVMTYIPDGISYRDVFPEIPTSVTKGLPVLGPVVGIIGTVMAAEAIKYLTGTGDLLRNRLLLVNLQSMDFQCINLDK